MSSELVIPPGDKINNFKEILLHLESFDSSCPRTGRRSLDRKCVTVIFRRRGRICYVGSVAPDSRVPAVVFFLCLSGHPQVRIVENLATQICSHTFSVLQPIRFKPIFYQLLPFLNVTSSVKQRFVKGIMHRNGY